MKRTAKTLCFPNWLEYEAFLNCAYEPLPQPGDAIRVGQAFWLVCDEEGYVRTVSDSLAYQLELSFQK